ncbi:MAG: hypothetical protein II630_01840 [Bacteroidales bacterium]|nr:hypothetical protein [Bacteroidales bacterium]
MENDKREYKERKPFDKQFFYFNEKGQLVVESNKGVWVDGEKFVKMYGDFVCNAKTMGEIIHQLKGIAVETGRVFKNAFDLEYYCVLGASKERIEEYEHELAKQEFVSKEIEELQKQVGEDGDRIYELKKSIENFNRLPWWKRMFKKVEV